MLAKGQVFMKLKLLLWQHSTSIISSAGSERELQWLHTCLHAGGPALHPTTVQPRFDFQCYLDPSTARYGLISANPNAPPSSTAPERE